MDDEGASKSEVNRVRRRLLQGMLALGVASQMPKVPLGAADASTVAAAGASEAAVVTAEAGGAAFLRAAFEAFDLLSTMSPSEGKLRFEDDLSDAEIKKLQLQITQDALPAFKKYYENVSTALSLSPEKIAAFDADMHKIDEVERGFSLDHKAPVKVRMTDDLRAIMAKYGLKNVKDEEVYMFTSHLGDVDVKTEGKENWYNRAVMESFDSKADHSLFMVAREFVTEKLMLQGEEACQYMDMIAIAARGKPFTPKEYFCPNEGLLRSYDQGKVSEPNHLAGLNDALQQAAYEQRQHNIPLASVVHDVRHYVKKDSDDAARMKQVLVPRLADLPNTNIAHEEYFIRAATALGFDVHRPERKQTAQEAPPLEPQAIDTIEAALKRLLTGRAGAMVKEMVMAEKPGPAPVVHAQIPELSSETQPPALEYTTPATLNIPVPKPPMEHVRRPAENWSEQAEADKNDRSGPRKL